MGLEKCNHSSSWYDINIIVLTVLWGYTMFVYKHIFFTNKGAKQDHILGSGGVSWTKLMRHVYLIFFKNQCLCMVHLITSIFGLNQSQIAPLKGLTYFFTIGLHYWVYPFTRCLTTTPPFAHPIQFNTQSRSIWIYYPRLRHTVSHPRCCLSNRSGPSCGGYLILRFAGFYSSSVMHSLCVMSCWCTCLKITQLSLSICDGFSTFLLSWIRIWRAESGHLFATELPFPRVDAGYMCWCICRISKFWMKCR